MRARRQAVIELQSQLEATRQAIIDLRQPARGQVPDILARLPADARQHLHGAVLTLRSDEAGHGDALQQYCVTVHVSLVESAVPPARRFRHWLF